MMCAILKTFPLSKQKPIPQTRENRHHAAAHQTAPLLHRWCSESGDIACWRCTVFSVTLTSDLRVSSRKCQPVPSDRTAISAMMQQASGYQCLLLRLLHKHTPQGRRGNPCQEDLQEQLGEQMPPLKNLSVQDCNESVVKTS